MSISVMPAGGAGFQQQGQVDWVSLSSSTLSFTVDLLARLAQAELHSGTVAIGNFICSGLLLKPEGQKRIRDALGKLKSFKSYGAILWFGFGVRPIIKDLADSESGLACVALCACLAISYDTFYAAQVLRDLCTIHETPKHFIPALHQWETLINICSGSLSGSNFPNLVEGFYRLVSREHLRMAAPTQSKALAEALHALSKLSQGTLANLELMGGVDCLWLAAVAEWLLCLRVEITSSDIVIYRSSNSVPSVGIAQVTIDFVQDPDIISQDQSLLLRKCHVVPNGGAIVNIRGSRADRSMFLSGRSSWTQILLDTFGSSFTRLLETSGFTKALVDASMEAESASLNGREPAGELLRFVSRYTPFHLARSTSRGQGYLNFAGRRLPELAGAIRAASKILEVTDYSESELDSWRPEIGDRCTCGPCSNKLLVHHRNYCLVAVTETILIFIWLLSVMEIDESLQPSSQGLMLLYMQVNKRVGDIKFTLLDAAAMILTGGERGGLETRVPCAISTNGVCVYFRALESLDLSPEEITTIRVVAGQIEWQGVLHHTIFDMTEKGSDYEEADPSVIRQLSCELLVQERRQPGEINVAYSLGDMASLNTHHILGISTLTAAIAETIRAPLRCYDSCQTWNFPQHPNRTLKFTCAGGEDPISECQKQLNLGWSVMKISRWDNEVFIKIHRARTPKLYMYDKSHSLGYCMVQLEACLVCAVRLSRNLLISSDDPLNEPLQDSWGPEGSISYALELADGAWIRETFDISYIDHSSSALEAAYVSGED